MKRTIIILTVAAALVLSAGLMFAKSGTGGQGSGGSVVDPGSVKGEIGQSQGYQAGGTGNAKGETLQTRDREMLQTRDGDCICYETKDGKLYEWNNSYNYQLKNYEKENDEKGLHRYLHEIGNRYRLENQSDVEGFVEWAFKNRPWNID